MSVSSRIGIVGLGYLGSYVFEQIRARPELGLEIAFVCEVNKDRLATIPKELILDDLSDFAWRKPALILETAHSSVTQNHGTQILEECDYMPLSLTALADQALLDSLVATAENHHRCLYIPHGAAVGMESLHECRDLWDEVTVTMKKNPKNLDFSAAPQFQPDKIQSETLLYDGPTRGVCPLFPRNVNSHAALALGGIGFDRTRSILIADPKLDVSVIEVEARGQGVEMKIQRSNPLKGVSGVFTLIAALSCLTRAKGARKAMEVC